MKIRAGLLILFLALLACGRAARAQDYYAQEKCSLCHIRESVFFDPKFAPPDRLKEFGEERLCGSCHNGSVRDSRALLWRGAQHPVPAARAARPCSWCHSPHSKGGWGVLVGSGASLAGGGDALCSGCHKGYASRGGPIHRGGFPTGGCRECHRAHGGTGEALLREGRSQLCLRCHAAADAARAGGHPVARAVAGTASGKQLPDCVGCHPVHGDAAPGSAAGSQCRRCHTPFGRAGAKDPMKHRAEGNCLQCHLFHSRSAHDGRGFRGKDMRVEALCGKCHEGRRAESVQAGREKGTHVTAASGGQGDLCFRCHRIHGGVPGTPLLVSAKAYSCLECHPDENTIRETGDLVLAHPVFERVPKGRLDAAVRAKRIVLGPKGEIVCRTCHAVHGATRGTRLLAGGAEGSRSCFWCHDAKLVEGHAPGGRGAGREVACEACHPVHGRKVSDGDAWRDVCTQCHPRESSHKPGAGDRERPRPKDLPAFDRKGRRVGIGALSCPTCHQPHGAPKNQKRLYRRYDSSAFLCTACHAKTEGVALTPHDLRGIAGKSLCEPCHLPHGGSAGLMWGLAGGAAAAGEETCRSCHREKGIATAVPAGGHPRNIVVARRLPEEFPLFRVEGQTAGILTCSTCHDVHGTGMLLYGRGTGKLLRAQPRWGEGGDPASDACYPCHPTVSTIHGGARCSQCHPVHRAAVPGGGCVDCHKRPGKGAAPAHVARGGCAVCHTIHSASPRDAESRCGACHALQARVAGTPHAEIGGGACSPCHPAHADLDNVTVKRRSWEEQILPADLACFRCHREGGLASSPPRNDHPRTRRTVPTTYGASVTIEASVTMYSRFQEAGKPVFPLFDEKGGRGANGRIGCLTCHDPHAGPAREGSGSAAGRYLRDPSNVFLSDLCAPCHKEGAEEHSRKFHTMPRKEG